MKNIIIKIFKTIIFVGPFLTFFIHMFVDTLLQQRHLLTFSSVVAFVFLGFGCVLTYMIWKNTNANSEPVIKKLSMVILKIFCYLMWFVVIAMLLFSNAVDVRCNACDSKHIRPIISTNGIMLNLNEGDEIKKYDKDGWQSCGCRKVVSFDRNSSYALKQIVAMGNYWIEYDDCDVFLNNYKVYVEEVNFVSNGSCYVHIQQDNEYKEIENIIVYDKQTNKLFYHYYRP